MNRTPTHSHTEPPKFVGLHLSGSNASKTALVVLEGSSFDAPLVITQVYEKIGSFGSLFSDERILEALTHFGPFAELFTDCPLTLPPCVACTRPVCPGAVKCDDVSVAMMLSLSNRLRVKGSKRSRPVNPQSQRLWDVMRLELSPNERSEPSYSANMAPLVGRARALQRRLRAVSPQMILKETVVASALEALRPILRLKTDIKLLYRNFERGRETREQIMASMERSGWVRFDSGLDNDADLEEAVASSVECFQAFVCAFVGALHHAGLTIDQPTGYVENEGWVYLPDVSAHVELPIRYFE